MIDIDKIYNMDCMEGFKLIDNKSVDMILTDIPYEINIRKECGLRKMDKGTADDKTFDLIEFLIECVRVLKGSIYICCQLNQIGIIYDFF